MEDSRSAAGVREYYHRSPIETVTIVLGSNIDAEKNLRSAVAQLRKEWPDLRLSHVYTSPAAEHTDQADFLNAAASFQTAETPNEVLAKLQTIEKELKKDPPFRYGPRTIDLDIVFFGNRIIDEPDLTIPHPKLHERRFVLEPLAEVIDEEFVHPVLKESVPGLLKIVAGQKCELRAVSYEL